MVNAMGVGIKRIEALYHAYNKCNERQTDKDINSDDGIGENRMPADMRIRSPYDPLCKVDVDEIDQEDPSGDEYLSGYCDPGVFGEVSPYDAHDASDDAGHAESE